MKGETTKPTLVYICCFNLLNLITNSLLYSVEKYYSMTKKLLDLTIHGRRG